MPEKLPEFLGREHFIAHGKAIDKLKMSINSFYILVSKKIFPNDKRLPDFAKRGLVIVRRDETNLGDLPEFAKYSRNKVNVPQATMTYRCEEYAVGTDSLVGVIEPMLLKPDQRPNRFGAAAVHFCADLLQSHGAILQHDSTNGSSSS